MIQCHHIKLQGYLVFITMAFGLLVRGQVPVRYRFTKENYPNPRVNYQACNRPAGPSWVCDPGAYLTLQQADEIDKRINGLKDIGDKYAVAIAIVGEIVLSDGSLATSNAGVREFAIKQNDYYWKYYARETIGILYHVTRNEVWTQTNTGKVTASCICQTLYESRQFLGEGRVYVVLDIFTKKFVNVLSGTDTCTTATDNVPWRVDSKGVCDWNVQITIDSVQPTAGSPTGGTTLVITGEHLDLSTGDILIDTMPCSLVGRSSSKIMCTTPRLLNAASVNKPLPVLMQLGSVKYDTGFRFTYGKPTLIDVHPMTTTVSGGLLLTVNGNNLDTVSSASMITLLRGTRTGKQSTSTTACAIRNSTVMLCPMPTLDISSVTSRVTKRDLARRRRARTAGSGEDSVAIEDVEVSVSFNLDGELSALDAGQSATITAYADPEFYRFDGDKRTETFVPVWPMSEKVLEIKGKGLLPVLKGHTLTVEIGKGSCDVTGIFSNLLVCDPPASQPPRTETSDVHPRVMVYVGSLHFDIGFLQYYDTMWKYPLTRYVIIGIAGVVLMLIILLFICCCCRRKHSQEKRAQNKKKTHTCNKDKYCPSPGKI